MPYFHLSTANPTGFRPWNFAMQTNGQRLSGLRNFRVARLSGPARLGRMQRLGRLGRLGDDGIPAGTRLLYNATFTPTENPLSPSFYNINSVIAAVAQNLDSQWGITVTSQQSSGAVFGTPTVVFQLQTRTAYGALQDIKSVIDGAFYNAAGARITSSKISVTSYPAATTGGSTAPPQDLSTLPIGDPSSVLPADSSPSWWSDQSQAIVPGIPNWMLLAIGGGILVGVPLLKRLL
ncbi:MAG TPA: hypothetical protein VKT29_17465 [Terriglobales bacterium]|jgi:hypothetical protein|nr:hypothetical protein [Bryobacteraceae bacterium]HLK34890.1 hypothetical protein [Terriglobales bacterium]